MIDEYYQDDDKFNRRKQQNVKAKERFAKDELKKKIKISVETSVIGALNDLETELGFVWCHGRRYQELTDDQKDMRDRWLDARDSILKRCANSIRIAFNEVDRCTITDYVEKRYKTIIKNNERHYDERER